MSDAKWKNEEIKNKLKNLGYHVKDWGFGIDVIRPSLTGKRKLMFHGTREEIIAWLKDNGEW